MIFHEFSAVKLKINYSMFHSDKMKEIIWSKTTLKFEFSAFYEATVQYL